MTVLEGDQQRLVDVVITKLKDGESDFQIEYPAEAGIDEDVSITDLGGGDYVGVSETRVDDTGMPIQTLMQRRSAAGAPDVRMFSVRELGTTQKVFFFGLPADPALVQGRSATATYTGDIFLTYSSDPSIDVDGISSGTANVTADFDAADLVGTATIVTTSANTSSGDFLNGATIDLSGKIGSGNEIAGTATLGSAAAGSSLTGLDATIDGAFYGQDATALGATVNGSVTTTVFGTLPLAGGLAVAE